MASPRNTNLKAYGRYGTVGIELVVSIVLGYMGGHWLDGKLGTNGWLTAVGVVVGVYAGFRALFKAAKFAQREVERLDAEEAEAKARYLKKSLEAAGVTPRPAPPREAAAEAPEAGDPSSTELDEKSPR